MIGGNRGRADLGADFRRDPRFNSKKIRFLMDGRELDVVDISATGISVRHAPGWVVAGQGLYFDLLVPVRNGMKKVEATGKVLRRQGTDIVVKYYSPHPDWRRLITQFLASR
ncbi:MAG: PilZ domain-containing protein [Alphaproteobacteria bacterium]|nr:PilZ domain-containing protein [Alphaproteobacteria bacterium]